MDFGNDNSRLYTITRNGLFSVWDTDIRKRESFKAFKMETLALIVCKIKPKIIIGFRN